MGVSYRANITGRIKSNPQSLPIWTSYFIYDENKTIIIEPYTNTIDLGTYSPSTNIDIKINAQYANLYQKITGSFPIGLSFDPIRARLYGTTEELTNGTTATYFFLIKASNSHGYISKMFSFSVQN